MERKERKLNNDPPSSRPQLLNKGDLNKNASFSYAWEALCDLKGGDQKVRFKKQVACNKYS